jgi:hypothetical protein
VLDTFKSKWLVEVVEAAVLVLAAAQAAQAAQQHLAQVH